MILKKFVIFINFFAQAWLKKLRSEQYVVHDYY